MLRLLLRTQRRITIVAGVRISAVRKLGVNGYRFSIAWPRILPEGVGKVNPLGLDFYDRLIDRLLEARITPFLCLHHWDLPKLLQDNGGWRNRDIVGSFTRYAMVVADRLGDRVRHWIAINEAYSIAYGGYGVAFWPPFIRDEGAYFAAAHHLNLAQGAVFKALASPGRKFGTAIALNPVRPSTPTVEDVSAARFHEAMSTKLFLDPLISGRYPDLVGDRVATVHSCGGSRHNPALRRLSWNQLLRARVSSFGSGRALQYRGHSAQQYPGNR